ncbi:group II intron reverse transcriptase/maturase [Lentisphaerota bacterium WC36G]|nr:group II intron reverse transcriptase/maturase [Lentisphaerae bacterium WC36]UDQ98888.1 group II intron reverse transcriptase/maturase [Lentisphaerae bacterium WC36]
MTKTTINLKKQRLRNNEYYNIQKTLDKLYQQSQNGNTFRGLMKIITQRDNILLAYRNIKRNKGSQTQGVDAKNIAFLGEMTTDELVIFIQKKLKNYFPKKVRRVEIPKPNGKTRPLGIPTIEDRLIQQCILQIMEPICEAKFYKHSYGFRPLRSAKHAIARSCFLINNVKLHYVVDVDIKGFFDNIDHGKLLKQLWTIGIQDKSLLKVISKMLKAEIDGIGIPKKGTPQGGILSPLLANIALNELDWWLDSQWYNFKSRYNYATDARDGSKSHMYTALKNTNLKEMYIVRYADDFKIFCRNYTDAKKAFIAVKDWLKTRLKLEISTEKSKITNLKKNYSEFLGIKLKVVKKKKIMIKKRLVNRYLTRSHIADKAKLKILKQSKELIKKIQHAKGKEVFSSIDKYNAYVIGIHNYYSIASNCSQDFSEIAFLSHSLRENRLDLRRKKYGEKLPRYFYLKYGKSKRLRFVNGKALLPISYVKFSRQAGFNGISIYVEKDRLVIHNKQKSVSKDAIRYLLKHPSPERSVEFNDNRISLFVAQYGKCAVTGNKLDVTEINCHHKIPIFLGGDDKYKNLIIVEENVHKLIHAQNCETISKYLKILNLDCKKIEKINLLRKQVQLPAIL